MEKCETSIKNLCYIVPCCVLPSFSQTFLCEKLGFQNTKHYFLINVIFE